MREEESVGVIELSSIVALGALDSATKLHGHISEDLREGGQRLTYDMVERSTISDCNHQI
jgi:hypothetical protein